MRQAFFTASDELRPVLVAAHRRAADGAGPDRRDERADGQALGGDLVGHRVEVVVAGVGIGVRMEQEQIDAFELLAVDARRWPSARASGRG